MQMRDQGSLQVRDQVRQNDGQIPDFKLSSATAPEYNNVRDANTALQHKASDRNENFDLRNGSSCAPAGDAMENEPPQATARMKVSKEYCSTRNNAQQEKLEVSDVRATACLLYTSPSPRD